MVILPRQKVIFLWTFNKQILFTRTANVTDVCMYLWLINFYHMSNIYSLRITHSVLTD